MRIAFVAMSGIRACDAELLELGLTLPGFVERSRQIASLPSLGLLTLAGLTPAHHDVRYHEVRDLDDPADTQRLYDDVDLVAISTFTAQARESYAIADRFRAAGAAVVMGGLHVTVRPDEALEHADAVVVGEGEPVWPEVLADAEAKRLRPRYDSRRGADGKAREWDLAEAPMPRYDLLDMDRYNRITVQTTRGCPWRCEFCASSILLTERYKHKPVERVLDEIDRICELWPRPFIEFADDNSFVDRTYWYRLLPELAKRNTRWFTETDVRVGEDDRLLGLMRAAGCKQVLLGLEAPTAQGTRGLELKTDFKRRSAPRVPALVANIQRHGIRVNGCFILGLDGQTPDVFDAVETCARDLNLFDVQVTLQTPFPGTPLYDRLAAQGRLLEPDAWQRCTLFDLTYVPDPMSAEQLVSGFRGLVRRLYSRDATARRRAAFRAVAQGFTPTSLG